MNMVRRIRHISHIISKDNVFVFAAQAAFYIIISSIPTLMMLIALVKFILPVSESDVLSAAQPFIPEIIKSPVISIISEIFSGSSFSIASITALSAFWSASRGVAAVKRGIRNVYHTPSDQNFILGIISDLCYTLVFIILIIIFLATVVFGSHIIDFLQVKSLILRLIFGSSPILKLLLTYGIMIVVFGVLYSAFSGRNLRFSHHLPGAYFTAGGWVIFSVLFSFYINNFSSYSYVYGSLTAIVLMMLWIYFCMVIFLLGGELNKLILVTRHNKKKRVKQTTK